ncbi:MAG: hypothetical protein GY897_11335 [Alteromonas sp.]|nr:hypothetical protein [Alteromonas sp.]
MHDVQLAAIFSFNQITAHEQLCADGFLFLIIGFSEQQGTHIHNLASVTMAMGADESNGIGFKQVLGCLGLAESVSDELLGFLLAEGF